MAEKFKLSFSAYVASAVLKEAQRDGAIFYGSVRGGACGRSTPERGEARCTTGKPALWWNRFSHAFFCEDCAGSLNQLEPGMCVLVAQEPASNQPPPLPPALPAEYQGAANKRGA
jgi:hypothetical protein